MAKKRVSKKFRQIIQEYVLVEVPKMFPDVNIPEWFLTDEVYDLIYRSWERDCLIKEQKSLFLEELYKRARGRHVYQKYDIDPSLEFDLDNVPKPNNTKSRKQSEYARLFRTSTMR